MKQELKQSIFSWYFLIAVAVTAFSFSLALQDIPLKNLIGCDLFITLFNLGMQVTPLVIFLPLIASLPCGFRFIDEVNSYYFRFSLSRSSVRKYAFLKAATAVITAFLAVFLGVLLCTVFFALIAKPNDVNDVMYIQLYSGMIESRTYGSLLNIGDWAYVLVNIAFMSLFGAIWPLFGMITCTYFKNRYVSMVMPFIAFFLFWQLLSRVGSFVPPINRYFVIINVYYGNYGNFEDPWLSAGLTVLFVLLWQTVQFLWFKKRIKSCS